MLRHEFLLDVFMAGSQQEEIHGRPLSSAITEAMEQAQRLLIIFTPAATRSPWVLGEYEVARSRPKPPAVYVRQDVLPGQLPVPLRGTAYTTFADEDDLLRSLRARDWAVPVIIPAAGEGTGLYPFSVGMPKTLFPVREKPILHHIIDNLDPRLFSKVIILAGRFTTMLEYYAKCLQGTLPIECIESQGRTLPLALKELDLKTTFMVHFSDIMIEGDPRWDDFIRQHRTNRREHGIVGTLMTSHRYKLPVGRITADLAFPQLIHEFTEKPDEVLGSQAINMAVSIFEPELLDLIRPDDVSLYGDTVRNAMARGSKFAQFGHDQWLHIQSLSEWHIAQGAYFRRRP
jgi:GTP:adenosylcobinamide-phosphate guanylyltransferase